MKYFDFDLIFIEICSRRFKLEQCRLDLDIYLAPRRPQGIIWGDDGMDFWRIYVD